MDVEIDVSRLAIEVLRLAVVDAQRPRGRLRVAALEFLSDRAACGIWADLAAVEGRWLRTQLRQRLDGYEG